MEKVLLYVHGRGGNAAEAAQFAPFCPGHTLVGVEYEEGMPWETAPKIAAAYDAQAGKDRIIGLLANSIGSFFAMLALGSRALGRALLISPLVDMEAMIMEIMRRANVSEAQLRAAGEIQTDFGETLSWRCLEYVRAHPPVWNVPTQILYAEGDKLIPRATVEDFARRFRAALTVMPGGEHWFHTPEQMAFLGRWMQAALK